MRDDLSLLEFVHSDWTFLNERLAQHYGIAGVIGQRAAQGEAAAETSHRGGVMTQASVLKVTADGTRTSPVLRGKWVLERIVGKPPAPPPPDMPLFEPDIRGATTIRQQLDKHRNTPACAACHVHIDPPGFALENFDADRRLARLLSRHQADQEGRRQGPTLLSRPRRRDRRRDAGWQVVQEHRRLQADPAAGQGSIGPQPGANLLIYATGADIQFADREVVEQIVAELRKNDYRFRTLIHEVAQSRVFLHK